MSAGWIERGFWVFVGALAPLGCEHVVPEPPPAPSRHEVPVAPPGARGARAAGTDAAPKPFTDSPDPSQNPEYEEGEPEIVPEPRPPRRKDVPL